MTTSFFDSVTMLPEDPILGLTAAFINDPRTTKVNLGVGAYKDMESRPLVLNSVRKAEEILLHQRNNKEYLPIDGDREYVKLLLNLIFGENSSLLKNGNVYGVQSIGGTGALRIGADFLAQQSGRIIYISNPTWPNHKGIFGKAGLTVDFYPYFDEQAFKLDFEGMCQAIQKMERGSAILLQACCHNPTGTDPSIEQWHKLSQLIKQQELIPFFDLAYQGFGSNLDDDAAAVRLFAEKGHEMLVAYSCSKNFGLYGERVGVLALVSESEVLAKIASQMRASIRGLYSNPPSHGARVVKTILTNPELRKEWVFELHSMKERISEMRKSLAAGLQAHGTKKDFSFMQHQNGMFSFCGLDQDQVVRLKQENGIYMPTNGRMNIAGLNPQNLNYVIEAILNTL
jgi:aspartate/tyrosine/aromatic aminotransferase